MAFETNLSGRSTSSYWPPRSSASPATRAGLSRRPGGEGKPMGCPPSIMVKFCLARAEDCRRNAQQATDPVRQWSWLQMEGDWFVLARGYDSERRTDLSM